MEQTPFVYKHNTSSKSAVLHNNDKYVNYTWTANSKVNTVISNKLTTEYSMTTMQNPKGGWVGKTFAPLKSTELARLAYDTEVKYTRPKIVKTKRKNTYWSLTTE